jgi:hypothetical protein
MRPSKILTDSRSVCGHVISRLGVCLFSDLLLSCLIAVPLTGCGNSTVSTGNTKQTQDNVETYIAGAVGNLQTYTVDHTANSFNVMSYSTTGGIVQDSGNISVLANGIEDLVITYYPGQELDSPPLTSSWLVEIPGEAGLAELEATNSSTNLTSTTFAPLAPTQSCPSFASAQTFLFVTVPKSLSAKSAPSASGWNPQIETAYGSVSVATKGSSVEFANIGQFTLPSANGGTAGVPMNPAPSTATAACSPTFFGETISYPTAVTVDNPGSQGNQSSSPSATIAIGPSGFLVEDAGAPSGVSDSSLPPYENLLGAGYGAIGLQAPSNALNTTTIVEAQFEGILYGAHDGSTASTSGPGFRLVGSFGFSNLAAACPTLPAPNDNTILYGGEFANNDPSANAFGNCDLAIDLGAQDASTNGLYTAATVYVSASFPYNSLGQAYSFPAVAIAGQISGKYAIFLIGVDTSGSPAQPWGIYLLQSN